MIYKILCRIIDKKEVNIQAAIRIANDQLQKMPYNVL